jgi:deoxyribose-phosphate aldolase
VNRHQIAALIDHTQLRAYASQVDIDELCEEAQRHAFHSVTINPAWTSYCARKLKGTPVVVNTCVGFPLGASTAQIKVAETREAVNAGATEVDMVINIGAIKSGYPSFVEKEIAAIVKAAGKAPVKVILETSFLNDDEKVQVCRMAQSAGAAFVKTSTGFGTAGATVEDVELMRQAVGDALGVKAAGGIRSYADAMRFIDAGATRLGTSAGIDILEEAPE